MFNSDKQKSSFVRKRSPLRFKMELSSKNLSKTNLNLTLNNHWSSLMMTYPMTKVLSQNSQTLDLEWNSSNATSDRLTDKDRVQTCLKPYLADSFEDSRRLQPWPKFPNHIGTCLRTMKWKTKIMKGSRRQILMDSQRLPQPKSNFVQIKSLIPKLHENLGGKVQDNVKTSVKCRIDLWTSKIV